MNPDLRSPIFPQAFAQLSVPRQDIDWRTDEVAIGSEVCGAAQHNLNHFRR
jgi:hypothetical protein